MNGDGQHTERLRVALAEIRGETRWVRAQLPDAFEMTDEERQAIALLMCSGAGLIAAATAAIEAVDAAPRRPVTACA